RREREHRLAVAEGHERELLALEELLDDNSGTGIPEDPAAHDVVDGRGRVLDRGADEDALPAREPVRLDDERWADLAYPAERGLGLGEGSEPRRRDVLARQELLREGLRALEPGGCRARPEGAE